MTYYEEQRKAFVELHNILKAAKANNTELNIRKLIIEMTQAFAIGRKPILERIKDMERLYGEYNIVEDVIVWKKK